jgi:hypothetical protein
MNKWRKHLVTSKGFPSYSLPQKLRHRPSRLCAREACLVDLLSKLIMAARRVLTLRHMCNTPARQERSGRLPYCLSGMAPKWRSLYVHLANFNARIEYNVSSIPPSTSGQLSRKLGFRRSTDQVAKRRQPLLRSPSGPRSRLRPKSTRRR